jgi:hypothetical protein
MKKKLNLFCVLMLVLIAAQIIVEFCLAFSESAQAFKQGWEDGGKEGATFTYGWGTNLLLIILGFVVIYFGIRATVSFIRFILNVNRDKVFIWENVRLLRWTGWGFLVAILCMSVHDLIVHIPLEKIYQDYSPMSDFTFGVFCLIVAEVFAIGLKLQEEQDLTI